jgi:alanyl-tRNA synthetase
MLTSSEIRQQFLEFFRSKQHTLVPSAPVIAVGDPTLMFTNSGMNQFKDVFLGTGSRPFTRCADTQKCIRVSGKHNDLEEVGVDTYHHTFFEMLGNWSFGDYFKKESIEWAYELLTQHYKISPDILYATVFEGDRALGIPADTEAESLWETLTAIPKTRILRFGKKDNFWEMGETGPCGPCTEIHLDRGEGTCDKGHIPHHQCAVNAGCARFIEIWNLVFMQYNRLENGELKTLPQKHVDTGMGFERLTAVLQGKNSNYDTDIFATIFKKIEELSGLKYGQTPAVDIAFRVVADHLRTLVSAFADNALPSNKGAGYVLRRVLRRATRYVYQSLNIQKPFLYRLVESVDSHLGVVFPEIRQRRTHIEKLILSEEESFLRTLKRGIKRFEDLVSGLEGKEGKKSKKEIPGDQAFDLYSTYGFPKDLIELMARELFLVVDQKGWELAEEKHKESGKSNIFNYEKDLEVLQGLPKTEIAFYRESSGQRQDGTFCQSKLLKLLGTDRVVLDKTPFYAESGGQLGDTGWITGSHFRFRVEDTQKQGELIVHYGTLEEGNLDQLPEEVLAQVEVERRKALMANHSATHLLHWALRDILGSSITQQGSLVAPDRLRFDFSSPAPLTTAQLREIEEKVNTAILENHRVCTQYEELESAKKKGALAMFGEKYAAQVRVVEMSNSKELCGGTHVEATGDIGLFSILSESPIQAGVRRITALTRWEALKRVQEDRELLESLGSHFKSPQNELKTRIFQLQEDLKQEKKEREYLEDKLVSFLGSALKQQALYQNSIHILVKKVEDAVDLKN